MRSALSRAGRGLLLTWRGRQPLIALDFDGTLAPIVSDPRLAHMSAATAELLRRVALRGPCVVLSGRARADVSTRVAGIPLAEVIGNHGSEPWLDPEPLRRWTAHAVESLRAHLSSRVGVSVEDKGLSVSVHYRGAFRRAQAVAAAQQAARSLHVGAIIHGKYVLNLLPPGALNKGQALLRSMRQLGCSHAVYVGDDATDEHAFALGARQGVLGIRVGYRRDSRATLYLRQQSEIDPLLTLLGSA